jgi:hypothetical protein
MMSVRGCLLNVRITPESRRRADIDGRLKSAISGREQSQQNLRLFDHLVGAAEQRERKDNAERLSGLEVDEQLDFCDLLYR